MRRPVLALALAAAAVLGATTAAQAQPQDGPPPGHDDVTARPGPGRRLVCLGGFRQLYLTPDEEDIPGDPPIPGPCPGQSPPSTSSEIVTLCIQGVTTTGHRGSTNPNGYPYPEGPCDGGSTTTTSAPRSKGPTPMRARPRYTG